MANTSTFRLNPRGIGPVITATQCPSGPAQPDIIHPNSPSLSVEVAHILFFLIIPTIIHSHNVEAVFSTGRE